MDVDVRVVIDDTRRFVVGGKHAETCACSAYVDPRYKSTLTVFVTRFIAALSSRTNTRTSRLVGRSMFEFLSSPTAEQPKVAFINVGGLFSTANNLARELGVLDRGYEKGFGFVC